MNQSRKCFFFIKIRWIRTSSSLIGGEKANTMFCCSIFFPFFIMTLKVLFWDFLGKHTHRSAVRIEIRNNIVYSLWMGCWWIHWEIFIGIIRIVNSDNAENLSTVRSMSQKLFLKKTFNNAFHFICLIYSIYSLLTEDIQFLLLVLWKESTQCTIFLHFRTMLRCFPRFSNVFSLYFFYS